MPRSHDEQNKRVLPKGRISATDYLLPQAPRQYSLELTLFPLTCSKEPQAFINLVLFAILIGKKVISHFNFYFFVIETQHLICLLAVCISSSLNWSVSMDSLLFLFRYSYFIDLYILYSNIIIIIVDIVGLYIMCPNIYHYILRIATLCYHMFCKYYPSFHFPLNIIFFHLLL